MKFQTILRKIQRSLYYNSNVEKFYKAFATEHPHYTPENMLDATKYIFRLNRAEKNHRSLDKVTVPQKALEYEINKFEDKVDYYLNKEKRKPVEDFIKELSQYDVISFDIFDTAVFRKVEFPNDVFKIMSTEMKHNDFVNIRKKAEETARKIKFSKEGTREVVLHDIYKVLNQYYGIDTVWEKREEELEIQLTFANDYIFEIYQKMLEMNKQIIFLTDMYLPLRCIKSILKKTGYTKYEKIYLSNQYKACKGDGSLQKVVVSDYPDRKIVHIGDNENSDIRKSREAGIDAYFNPVPNLEYREEDMDNMSGSFYRSIISTSINNGLWNKDIHYEYGFRVGGILAAGFCMFINDYAKQVGAEKILFCSRDCSIIHKVYNDFYREHDNEYIQISRYAIMSAACERYMYDLYNRFVLKHIRENSKSKTISAIYKECGFDFLNSYLKDVQIDGFAYPTSLDLSDLETFFYSHREEILKHCQPVKEAAKKYFSQVLGKDKNILIVDIGWSGTCITALQYFMETEISSDIVVHGALMCSSKGKALTNSVSEGSIASYIYSPLHNTDLADYMMEEQISREESEIRHMSLEYLFTSTDESLIKYCLDNNGSVVFERIKDHVVNPDEILEMQKGIYDFNQIYYENTKDLNYYRIPAYVAFNPLYEAITYRKYLYRVYKNFTYDARTVPYSSANQKSSFSSLFPIEIQRQDEPNTGAVSIKDTGKKRILFVTPELTYTGTPRSLLRMCKVALSLDYDVTVWSAKNGPFAAEYQKYGIPVRIVPEKELLSKREVFESVKDFDLAICNTIVTDRYERICSKYIPTVWYIREATNIPDFCRNNVERLLEVKKSRNIYCVSDYAAKAISEFTDQKINIVHNCVEDESDLATDYIPGTGKTVKFAQLGTFEYRKGYDVLTAAYKSLPKKYRDQIELFFAGGMINSGLPYCQYLFSEIKDEKNIHNLGLISDEKQRIETLSNMDVIVVASRDESCSLVALEGTMLSKPIIVTENVGAKYIAHEDNSLIVKTDDVKSLADAMKHMVDHKDQLSDMGKRSRYYYDNEASMDIYTELMKKIFDLSNTKGSLKARMNCIYSRLMNNRYALHFQRNSEKKKDLPHINKNEDVIVSLTSHPGRMNIVPTCIESLLNQKSQPKKVLLWLSEKQFPGKEKDLPEKLLQLEKKNDIFEIRWASDDLAPHKKYFYTVQEYPELPVIVLDDDAVYNDMLVSRLMDSYRKHPDCVSCMRANLITFDENKKIKPYSMWVKGYSLVLDIPCYNLLPTGVGGVLYPPHSLPKEAFDVEAIKDTCLFCDDLWLKAMTTQNGYKTVIPKSYRSYKLIEDSQNTALWFSNVHQGNNDISMEKIIRHCETVFDGESFIEKIRKDRFR